MILFCGRTSKVNDNAILFLQPEWSKQEEMTPFIVDYVMSNQNGECLFKHINILIFLKEFRIKKPNNNCCLAFLRLM
jgi:hypothetical protein